MRQLDVFANPKPGSADAFPYLVILQSDDLPRTSSVIVAPLVAADPTRAHSRLYPLFTIEGRPLVLAVTDLASVPRNRLNGPAITSLMPERHRIIAALDYLFTGI
ncbi:MAG TPA: CcdB family protein [Beijerinckiaceae bacterium]|jgi:toxin CcdB